MKYQTISLLLCNHTSGDLFTLEENVVCVNICFRQKAHLVFHWCLYNKICYLAKLTCIRNREYGNPTMDFSEELPQLVVCFASHFLTCPSEMLRGGLFMQNRCYFFVFFRRAKARSKRGWPHTPHPVACVSYKGDCNNDIILFWFFVTVTEEKLQVAEEHIESLEQQLADSEKKAAEANQKGTLLTASFTW